MSNPLTMKDSAQSGVNGICRTPGIGADEKKCLASGRYGTDAPNARRTNHYARDEVAFAPGLGLTAQLARRRRPASCTAVERDPEAIC